VRYADLPREQDVLTRLGHRAFGGGDDQDRAVHLGRAGDHVLHIVGVTRTVDVSVVPRRGLVLHVSGCDGDAAGTLLRRAVDVIERQGLPAIQFRHHLGERGCQRRLAMVHVTDGADVHVRLGALELFLLHVRYLRR
jgi:hypothetical protein